MLRVNDAQGHLIGMARMNGSDISVLAPQQEPGFTTVKSVANAYWHPTNGAPPPVVSDPAADLAARRAGGLTAPGVTSAMTTAQRSVKAFTDEGVVVFDPDLRADVTIAPDGMRGSWIIQANGYPPSKVTAEYEGGEHPSSGAAKTGKLAKGFGTAIAQGLNHSANAVVNVDNNPDKSWRIKSQGANGKATEFESGGYRMGGSLAYGRDPVKLLGMKQLQAFKLDLEVAKAASESAAKDGQAPKFSLSSERSQRGWNALQEATKAYDLK
jgi:hypothetical protein